ncbi:MAG: type IV pilus biogenesis/stability protein PilW [Lysobacterales bacterium]
MLRNSGFVCGLLAAILSALITACSGQMSFGRIDASRGETTRTRESATDRIDAEEDPLRGAEINVSLGRGYMSQGQNEIALQKFRRALEIAPNMPIAHTAIAVLYERIGDDAAAGKHYQRAADLDKKSGVMNNNYATWLCRHQRFKDADRRFAIAIADPFYKTPSVALGNRAHCALASGNLTVAEISLDQALTLDPNNSVALLAMADLQYQRKQYFRARAFVQRYESAQTASADSLLLAMQIEQALGNAGTVSEYRNRLHREFPQSAQARSVEQAGVIQ